MKILITGTSGFVAGKLAEQMAIKQEISINGKTHKISKMACVDIVAQALPITPKANMEIAYFTGSLTSLEFINSLNIKEYDVIYHLAALCSAGCEEDFAQGMDANFFSSYNLLEACRTSYEQDHKQRVFIYSSSTGVFGGEVPAVIADNTWPTPQGSYGTQKAICELLINDYNRKGYIDGRALRFPTIIVRPGKPNTAASSFCSGIVREPLNGKRSLCPVASSTSLYYLSPDLLIKNIFHATHINSAQLGFNRILTLPGITLAVSEIVAALKTYGGQEAVDLIEFKQDKAINDLVQTWPCNYDAKRALQLGFYKDENVDVIVKQYFDGYIKKGAGSA